MCITTHLIRFFFAVGLLLSMSGCQDVEQSTTNSPDLKIISYNLRYANADLGQWQRRKSALLAFLRDSNADLIAVQEADWPWMEVLTAQMTEYEVVGVGRDDGNKEGEFAAIFYRKEKLALLGSETFWLSETPETPSYGWGATNRRIATVAEFVELATGLNFVHFNTHLDHQSQLARRNGLDLILQRLVQYQTPAILSGDFNFPQNSELYRSLDDSTLVDSRVIARRKREHGTFNWFQRTMVDLGYVIDYILVSKGSFTVDSYNVNTSYHFDDGEVYRPVSDHYPVVIEINFK